MDTTMANVPDWVTHQIAEARKYHPSVTDAASDRIEELLHVRLGERQIPPSELDRIAMALIDDMATPPKNQEVKR